MYFSSATLMPEANPNRIETRLALQEINYRKTWCSYIMIYEH